MRAKMLKDRGQAWCSRLYDVSGDAIGIDKDGATCNKQLADRRLASRDATSEAHDTGRSATQLG